MIGEDINNLVEHCNTIIPKVIDNENKGHAINEDQGCEDLR